MVPIEGALKNLYKGLHPDTVETSFADMCKDKEVNTLKNANHCDWIFYYYLDHRSGVA